MIADRLTDRRRPACSGSNTESQHGATRVGIAECTQRATSRCGVVHDHPGQRLTEGRLDRQFPTLVDLDEIEEGAEHTVDIGESLCAGPRMSSVERHLQRLDASGPPRRFLGGLVAGGGARLRFRLGGRAGTFCQLDLDDQRSLHAFRITAVLTETIDLCGEFGELRIELCNA